MKPTTLQLFKHSLYEYEKGVRKLQMMTLTAAEAAILVERLDAASIDHYRQEISPEKVNLFFGRAALVKTAQQIVTKPLNLLSPEEDFILGTLLGYDGEQQCLRYLAKKAPHPQ
ncbi:MAG: DUF2023 family protein [Rhodospirillaceae bacterium]|nr:DUF2023 family protein [Rhodospirillaceae bacterium]